MATAYEFSLAKEISVEKPAALGTYTLKGTKTVNEGTSMTFPATSSVWEYSQFVDLGFGNILWATGNLTETSPYIADPLAAGDYYKWGYTTPYDKTGAKDAYDNYKADGDFEDTAAAKNTNWSMPTKNQFDALYKSENTSSKWVSGWTSIGNSNGGYFITSEKNGLSLFLAAAGYYNNGSLNCEGDDGDYWSSSPLDASGACNLVFDSGDIDTYNYYRKYGQPVRPVKN